MSCSTFSTVILKDSFSKIFFHYGNQKTIAIFAELNHQFLNIFLMNSSIVTFWWHVLKSQGLASVNPVSWSGLILCLWFTALVLNIQNILVLNGVTLIRVLKDTLKIQKSENSDLWVLSCNMKFENSMISAWVGALQKLTQRLNLINRSFENVNFTFK